MRLLAPLHSMFCKGIRDIISRDAEGNHSENVKESSPAMIVGMAVLALLCLIYGIFPGAVISMVSPAVFTLTGSYGISSERGFLSIGETLSGLSPITILLTMVLRLSQLLFCSDCRG